MARVIIISFEVQSHANMFEYSHIVVVYIALNYCECDNKINFDTRNNPDEP